MKKKPNLHLCKKSETLQLPHLLKLNEDPKTNPNYAQGVWSEMGPMLNFIVEFPTTSLRIVWVKEFGVN